MLIYIYSMTMFIPPIIYIYIYIYILDKIDIVENISVVVNNDGNVNKTRQLVRLSGLLTSTHLQDWKYNIGVDII